MNKTGKPVSHETTDVESQKDTRISNDMYTCSSDLVE